MNIVVMAGGGGTRLWPVSREKMPKQFTQLFGKKTLLQHTVGRALKIVRDPSRIVITTRAEYVAEIRAQVPKIPKDHILVEPIKRDTAPSIGMAAAFLAAKGRQDEPMILMPSDHAVLREDRFIEAIRAMGTFITAEPSMTVLLGSKPTYPETGYGYIEFGRARQRKGKIVIHGVKRFREKPKLALAKRFVNSGGFVWNMGVYGWRVRTLLELLHTFSPDIARRLDTIEQLFKDNASLKKIHSIYRAMPAISIDFAVTDRQDPKTIVVLPGDYGWSDVGHWGALEELQAGGQGVELKRGIVMQIKSSGNFVYNAADVAVALAGTHNLVVVSTPDAILICDKAHVQDVKKIVEELQKSGHTKFL